MIIGRLEGIADASTGALALEAMRENNLSNSRASGKQKRVSIVRNLEATTQHQELTLS